MRLSGTVGKVLMLFRLLPGSIIALLIASSGLQVDEAFARNAQGVPAVRAAEDIACQPNPQEARIAELMMAHPNQKRVDMRCNPILAQVARARAQDMADRGYFSHVNPDGFGPNHFVRQAGYILPAWWGTAPAANYIESIAMGHDTGDETFNQWLSSAGHRRHILAEVPFYAGQVEYGIGYVAPGRSHIWVAITAQPGP